MTTKIHAVVDGLGNPVYLTFSQGQEADSVHAIPLPESVPVSGNNVIADKAYDSDEVLNYIYEHDGWPTIPPKSNRLTPLRCDWWLYKERHLVECFFNRLKNFRRVATRYDKLISSFAGFCCLASICLLVK